MSQRIPYVYVCVGCDLLDEKTRADQLTCSTACRVRAHRNGSLEALRAQAKTLQIAPRLLVDSAAVWRLVPDLAEQIMRGEVELDDPAARRRVYAEFVRLLIDAERNASAEALQEATP
jgi:hypothetical protein